MSKKIQKDCFKCEHYRVCRISKKINEITESLPPIKMYAGRASEKMLKLYQATAELCSEYKERDMTIRAK